MISIKESEEILKKEYNRDNFEYLLSDILLPDYKKSIHEVCNNNSFFSSVELIGESSCCELSVFEVILNNDVQGKRVAITQEMFKILRNFRINNAIVSFVNSDKNNYRISLLTSKYEYDGEKIVKVISNPRRYSYYLGFNTKTKTPYKYLIEKGSVSNLEELKERFSVEIVNKQFYSEIANCYTSLVGGEREGKKYSRCLSFEKKEQYRKYQEFAVRLIGRIMFCWFLKEKKSDNGIALVPEEILTIDNVKNHDNYYHEILEPLFFELLNVDQDRRRKPFKNEKYNNIPYLNGGLFSPHPDDFYKFDEMKGYGKLESVIVPNEWIIKFYEVLCQYNFTVDENTSYDIELSIDPEMLGRIFENLLAEIDPDTGENAKKSTGSFYTPRDIVDYMVDNSLLEYLTSKTNISSNKIRWLISYSKDYIDDYTFSELEKKKIIDSLYSITVLDPACGSGAFPIGMLQKIVFILQEIDPSATLWLDKATANVNFLLKKEIQKKFDSGSINYIRKLSVIQNSIFGIDIQPIAVEISRLRCFLSLVIEEKVDDTVKNRGINPLPNLDFKFIIANSLNKLDKKRQISLFQDDDYFSQLKEIITEYFNADNTRRVELKLLFKDIQQDMMLDTINKFSKISEKRDEQLYSWKPFENKLTDWFDSEWMFGIKDGFDIVIGNPPYVDYRKINSDSFDKKFYIVAKYSKMINLYIYFFEMGINLLKDNGILAYISPQQYLTSPNTRGLRDLLRTNRIISLSDFSLANVFEAGTYPFVTIIKKEKSILPLKYFEFNQIQNTKNYYNELDIPNPIPEPIIISKYVSILNKMSLSNLTLQDKSINIFVACSSTNERLTKGDYRYIEASDIFENKIISSQKYINYSKKYSKNHLELQINNDIIYTSRMTSRIRAVYLDNNKEYLGGKVNVVVPLEDNAYYLTALLNSNAVNFWFRERFGTTHMRGGALPINGDDLKYIPIPVNNSYKEEIDNLMGCIYNEKLSDKDLVEINNKIEDFIYKSYNLDKDEISIIEKYYD